MKTKRFLLTAGIVLAMAFTFSCSSDDGGVDGCPNPSVSGNSLSCGGQTYKIVVIGSQTWMAENLNYDPGSGNSVCYDNKPANCVTYGRLYDWSTARSVCPSGWHLPSYDEWAALDDNATDEYDFLDQPGGKCYPDGYFESIGRSGSWWSSTECDSEKAYSRSSTERHKGYLLSVRCLQD